MPEQDQAKQSESVGERSQDEPRSDVETGAHVEVEHEDAADANEDARSDAAPLAASMQAEDADPSVDADAKAEPDTSAPVREPGPDPLWGAAVAFFGFFVMAFGGATDRHYVFNVGSGLMLLGAFVFLVHLAVSNYRLEPFNPVAAIRALWQRRS